MAVKASNRARAFFALAQALIDISVSMFGSGLEMYRKVMGQKRMTRVRARIPSTAKIAAAAQLTF